MTIGDKRDRKESVYSDLLAGEIGGQREVRTPVGKIDLLTEFEVIEVKDALGWKWAIGQVLLYGQYYPHLGKRIHLFGHVPSKQKELIEIEACRLSVRVTWLDHSTPLDDLSMTLWPNRQSLVMAIINCLKTAECPLTSFDVLYRLHPDARHAKKSELRPILEMRETMAKILGELESEGEISVGLYTDPTGDQNMAFEFNDGKPRECSGDFRILYNWELDETDGSAPSN